VSADASDRTHAWAAPTYERLPAGAESAALVSLAAQHPDAAVEVVPVEESGPGAGNGGKG
jgi:hypothetical protein